MKVVRNSGLDMCKAIMMLGIIILHIIVVSGKWESLRHYAYVLYPCVDGFVLISGYFGVKFSVRKISRLYLVALFYAFVFSSLAGCCHDEKDFIQSLLDGFIILKQYWFLHSYVVLLVCGPLVDRAIGDLSDSECLAALLPFLIMVFGWGWMSHLIGCHHVIPTLPDFEPKSGLTLLGVYVIGRIYSRYEASMDGIPKRYWIVLNVCMLGIVPIGLGWFGFYNSPIAVCLALSFMHLCKQCTLSSRVGMFFAWLSPTIFSIYIIHSNACSYKFIHACMMWLLQARIPMLLSVLIMALTVFVASVALDRIRICCLKVGAKWQV